MKRGAGPAVCIDDGKLGLAEFGRLLNVYAGWGMRIAFVPADEVTEQPEIEVRDPPLEGEDRNRRRVCRGDHGDRRVGRNSPTSSRT